MTSPSRTAVMLDAADLADPQRGSALTRAAHRLGGTADDLDAAAALWRDGDLS